MNHFGENVITVYPTDIRTQIVVSYGPFLLKGRGLENLKHVYQSVNDLYESEYLLS